MRIIGDTHIPFVQHRKKFFILSAVFVLIGIGSLFYGLEYSIDFMGGSLLMVQYNPIKANTELDIQKVRQFFNDHGFEDAEIQKSSDDTGNRYLLVKFSGDLDEIRTSTVDSTSVATPAPTVAGGESPLFLKMSEKFGDTHTFTQKYMKKIGPRIGQEMRSQMVWAIIYSLLFIILYIWIRFQFTFGLAAVIALFHDVMITIGLFALTGREISLTVVAAFLTIVGYSLNDTIVLFDRIREDLKKAKNANPDTEIVNASINEVLNRTIITSLTTLIVVLCLYFFGGVVIHDFAFALLVGVIVGTYSSIFIASPLLVEYFDYLARKKGLKRTRK